MNNYFNRLELDERAMYLASNSYDGSNCCREIFAQIKPKDGGNVLYTDDFHYL